MLATLSKRRYSLLMPSLTLLFRPAPLFSLVCLSAAAHAADPLFQKMEGHWIAQGERTHLVSGRVVRIDAEVSAVIRGDRLHSHNEITETSASGSVRKYVRDYWVRPRAEVPVPMAPRHYDFGTDEIVTSQGSFDGGILEVEQRLGGNPPYLIRSRTEFSGGESLYQENAWHGDTELTRTRVRYTRR